MKFVFDMYFQVALELWTQMDFENWIYWGYIAVVLCHHKNEIVISQNSLLVLDCRLLKEFVLIWNFGLGFHLLLCFDCSTFCCSNSVFSGCRHFHLCFWFVGSRALSTLHHEHRDWSLISSSSFGSTHTLICISSGIFHSFCDNLRPILLFLIFFHTNLYC